NAAIGRTQAIHSAAHARCHDAASGLAADTEADQSRGGRSARSGTGARSAFVEIPRIHCLTAEPNVVQCQSTETELRDQYSASIVQLLHDGCIAFWDAIAERLGSIRGADPCCVEQILSSPRNAVQRPAILAGGDLFVRLLSLLEGEILGDRDDTAKLGVE